MCNNNNEINGTDRKSTVLRLLKGNRDRFHIEYGGYLSNHLSHALIALYKLEAPPSKINNFFEMYINKLEEKIPAEKKISKNNWKEFKGKKENYTGLVEFYKEELSKRRVDDVLNEFIPELIEGLSGSAFHGLITLGYALEFMEDTLNIAEGLAYWTFCFSSLGISSKQGTFKDPLEIFKEVKEDRIFDNISNKKLKFHESMMEFKKYPQALQKYDIYISPNASSEELMHEFMKLVVDVFLKTGAVDFFLLHGVTSMRALKTVLSHIHDKEIQLDALRFFWRAVLCTYVIQGEKAIKPIGDYESKHNSWANIIDCTLHENDEHLLKLVFVCHDEAKQSEIKDRLFKETAQRALHHYITNKHNWNY